MSLEMWVVLAILGAAVFLFVTEWLRVDLVAMGAVLALMLSGVLTTGEALAGFSSTAVLTITFLFIVGGAVWQTGLADQIGQRILRIAGGSELRLLVVLMVAVAILSGFMSNTGTVAVLLPAVIVLAKNADISPSKLLIPLSFGSMLGGAMTLIGTPPNIIVNGVLREGGYEPFGFFSFLPMGAILLVVGTGFMVVVGRYLLPDHKGSSPTAAEKAETPRELAELYKLPEKLRRLHIPAGSPLAGRDLATAQLRRQFGVHVLKVMRPPVEDGALQAITEIRHNRDSQRPRDIPIVPDAQTVLKEDDVLIVEDENEMVDAAAARWRLDVRPAKPKDMKSLAGREVGIAEVVLPPRSHLIGKTITDLRFGDRYNLSVLKLTRPRSRGPARELPVRTTPLQFGDTLLVQGRWKYISALRKKQHDFVVMGQPEETMGPPHQEKAGLALVIMLGMIGLMLTGVLPTVTVILMAALAMVLSGCLTMDEAYEAIDWKSVVLIAGMLPISTALEKVGLVGVIATSLVETLGALSPLAVMAGLFLLTAVFTQLLSNTATAVVIAPIAFTAAQTLGLQPHAFLMAVGVAASMAFASPVASPTNTLVMGAGQYSFGDYAKVGVPLLLLSMVLSLIFLPLLFPF